MRGGAEHLMLIDRATSPERMAIPSILAVGAVHAHLVRQQLRTFTSINVASGECLDVHHFAVLIGVGATTINPWLAEDLSVSGTSAGCCRKLILPRHLKTTARRSKTACSRSCRRWVSRCFHRIAAAIILKPSACHGHLWPAISRR